MERTALVAGPGSLEWNVKLVAQLDDVGLGHRQERRQDLDARESFDGEIHHRRECADELRPAIRVDEVVAGVRTECNGPSLTCDGERTRDAEHDRVAIRHHGDPHALVGVMPVGNGHTLVGQRRPAQDAGESRRMQVDQCPRRAETG